MNTPMRVVPGSVAVGVCLSLLGMLLGFSLGGLFGSLESSIRNHLDNSGTAVLQSVYHGDVAAKDAAVRRSWGTLQKAHLHGGAIGSAALGSILALILLSRLGAVARLSALAFGSGAVIYPLSWLLTGLAAPGWGGVEVARESLSFVAIPGAGLCILGLCGTIFCVARTCLVESAEA